MHTNMYNRMLRHNCICYFYSRSCNSHLIALIVVAVLSLHHTAPDLRARIQGAIRFQRLHVET